MAPLPPTSPSEVTELKGTTTPDKIPNSRGEWDQVIPSVLQRRQSFGEKLPEKSTSSARSSDKQIPTNSKMEDKPKEIVGSKNPSGVKAAVVNHNTSKGPAPQPPSIPQITSKAEEKEEIPTKTGAKKVIKRTVSVKRSIIPPSSSTFGDGPPDDGHDYIKICGRWVQMKKSGSPQRLEGKQNPPPPPKSPPPPLESPPPPAEWADGVKVGKMCEVISCVLVENLTLTCPTSA